MRTDRLLRLAALLEEDAANDKGIKFDLGQWAEVTDPDNPVSCGTQGCAIGLALVSGIFKDEGFGSQFQRQYHPTYLPPGWQKGNAIGGWSAIQAFFEIDHDQAIELFLMDSYVIVKGAEAELEVADRIRRMCR